MRLQSEGEHPHGLSDREYDAVFTRGQACDLRLPRLPVAHHRLTYRRHDTTTSMCAGYIEEGTTTTPFDMVMMNDMDRFHS